jgi:hypothetical protein
MRNFCFLISPRTETGDCRSLGSGGKGAIAPKNLLTGFWFSWKMGDRFIIVNY